MVRGRHRAMFADELNKLAIEILVDGARAQINVAGELDMTSAPRLIAAVHDVAASPIQRIDLNCERVSFLDSAGVRALIVGHNEAGRMSVDLALVEPSRPVARILELTGLTGILTR